MRRIAFFIFILFAAFDATADVQLFSNNASSTLSVALTSAQTSATVADGSGFESPAAGEYELLTITDGTNTEIVKLTARSTNTLTIAREQEGTTAPASFAIGSTVEGRVTAGTLDGFAQGVDNSRGAGKGTDALDIQSDTSAAGHVASGDQSIAIGYRVTGAGNQGIYIGKGVTGSNNAYQILIGFEAVSTVQGGVGVGYRADVSGQDASAFGVYAEASGSGATSLGDRSIARIAKTTNISGPVCVRKDAGETDLFKYFAGAEVVIMTDEVDLTSTADDVATVTISSGAKFFPDECGVIVTSADTVTGQPNVEFGVTGTTDELLTATATTGDAAGERDRYTSLATDNGQTTFTMSVETGATATALLGRGYCEGILVENE